MTNIDFLPAEYRRRTDDRKNRAWRMAVLIVFGLMIASTAFYQHTLRRQANRELAEVAVLYDLAIARLEHLNKSHAELRKKRGAADLYVLLDHAWSRTQILQAVLETLPEEATLSQLQINGVTRPTRGAAPRSFSVTTSEEEKVLAHLLPEERDQKLLREKLNATQTVVVLTGTTRDQRTIHDYVARLEKNNLFVKVEITSIEQARSDNVGVMLFGARLVVRPAYGLAGGPTGQETARGSIERQRAKGEGLLARGPRSPIPGPQSSISASTTSSRTEVSR